MPRHQAAAKIIMISAAIMIGVSLTYNGPEKFSLLDSVVTLGLFGIPSWLPFLILYGCIKIVTRPWPTRLAMGAIVLAMVVLLIGLQEAFFPTDAQSGLVFVAIPMLLLPFSIVASVICILIEGSPKRD